MEKHLKPHLYYSDLYDRHTVEKCRRIERIFDSEDDIPSLKNKRIGKKKAEAIKLYAKNWALHIEAGERYINKGGIIREWMDVDQKRDELYGSAEAPEEIRCLTCRNLVKPTFKQLWTELDKEDRVLFMYDCPNKCVPRRAFFSGGEEWRTKPNLCPRCGGVLVDEAKDDGKKLITTHSCSKCGYSKIDEIIWTHKDGEKIDENFSTDRDRFCLTDEEGGKYQQEKWNMEQMGKFMEEWKEEEKARDEKLKANPKGFHLEGRGYRCSICGEGTPEGDNWYDQYGIKCLVCQKAIDEGEIPASLAKNKESWYSTWEFDHYFNIKSQTLKKWVREGIIRSRTVSSYGNGVHVELFLLKDNKDFLPPKKLIKSRSVTGVKDGKTWFRSEEWYKFVDPVEHLKGYRIMKYLRVVPPEEMKAREEEEKRKWEEKQARREAKRLLTPPRSKLSNKKNKKS